MSVVCEDVKLLTIEMRRQSHVSVKGTVYLITAADRLRDALLDSAVPRAHGVCPLASLISVIVVTRVRFPSSFNVSLNTHGETPKKTKRQRRRTKLPPRLFSLVP